MIYINANKCGEQNRIPVDKILKSVLKQKSVGSF